MAARTVNDTPTLTLSSQKLKALQPELYSSRSWQKFLRENGYRLSAPNEDSGYWKNYVEESLRRGDCGPAIVVSTSPLLVAAYSRELDCVAALTFPAQFVAKYKLKNGARLLAVSINLEWNFFLPEDLNPGPCQTGKYRNFAPLIAEFLTDDAEIIENKKAEITGVEWDRAEALGREYFKQNGEKARDGRPLLCHLPAKMAAKMAAKSAKAPAKTRRR